MDAFPLCLISWDFLVRLVHGQGFPSWRFQDDPEELHKNEEGLFGSSIVDQVLCIFFNELGYCTNQKGQVTCAIWHIFSSRLSWEVWYSKIWWSKNPTQTNWWVDAFNSTNEHSLPFPPKLEVPSVFCCQLDRAVHGTAKRWNPPIVWPFRLGSFQASNLDFSQKRIRQRKIQADRWFVGSSLYFSEGTDWMTFFGGFHLFVDEVHIPKQGRLSKWSAFLFFFFSVNEETKSFSS